MNARITGGNGVRQRITVLFMLAVSCLTVQSLAFSEEFTIDSPTWTVLRGQSTPAAPTYTPALDPNRNIMRQAPALSGRFQLKDQTFIPFIGAGFGGGYTTDRDRALGSNWPQQNQTLSGDTFGKNMMPNEVNMGFRIPF